MAALSAPLAARTAFRITKGGGPDEALARGRLHDPHRVARRRRQAHELECLVGGDPAADAEQDPGHVTPI